MKRSILSLFIFSAIASGSVQASNADEKSYSITIYKHSEFNKDWETQGFQYNRALKDYSDNTSLIADIQKGKVNNPPSLFDDRVTATTGVDQILDYSIFGNDSDPDGDEMTLESVTQPESGTITQNGDGTLTYKSNPDFSGLDVFTYRMADVWGESSEAQVLVEVSPSVAPEPIDPEEPLTAPENEWINFFNDKCGENYKSWTDVNSDGYINCSSGLEDTDMPEIEIPQIENPEIVIDFSNSCISDRKWKFFHRFYNRDGKGKGHHYGWRKFMFGKKTCGKRYGGVIPWLVTKIKEIQTNHPEKLNWDSSPAISYLEEISLRHGAGIFSDSFKNAKNLKKIDVTGNKGIKDFSFLKYGEFEEIKVEDTDFVKEDFKYVKVKNDDESRIKCRVKDKSAYKHFKRD